MNFHSDNLSGILPEVLAAFAAAAQGPSGGGLAESYGQDPLSRDLDRLFGAYFGHEVAVVTTATGTAANALALATICPPTEAIVCHAQSHVNLREAGAPEFFTQGAKLVPLDGPQGRIRPADLEALFARSAQGREQSLRHAVVSLTQPTERGTLYSLEDLRRLCAIAHGHGALVHVDGARFAQAVVALGCSPAEASWQAGVDVLSYGGTKGGGFAAEAIVFFDRRHLDRARLLHKRAGQTVSKMRFLSCQWPALIETGALHASARASQRTAAELEDILRAHPGVAIEAPRQINMVFARLPHALADRLRAKGVGFHAQASDEAGVVARFVTSFATRGQDLDGLRAALAEGEGA